MFGIGEFSKITGLSIKALRLYHEQGMAGAMGAVAEKRMEAYP